MINRREFALAASVVAAAQGGGGAADKVANQYLDLRWYMLRNSPGQQFQRTQDYLQAILPVLKDAGAKTVGIFTSVIGPDTPFLISLTAYPALALVEEVRRRMEIDKTVAAALRDMSRGSGPPFVRMEASLLRAFDGFPEAKAAAEPKAGRVFELRRYESDDLHTLADKISMFNDGEIGVFQRLGMQPVFFGETLYGSKMPNLTYMLSFDDLAARDRLWHAFGADGEWKKMSAKPELQDERVVSNISNWILRALPFSEIR